VSQRRKLDTVKKHLLLAYLALTAVCIIWGTTFLALRIAVTEFPPFLFTVLRQTVAGGILLIVSLGFMKVPMPSISFICSQAVAGFFMISLGNGLVAWAEMFVPSGVAAILCSLMPVMVILINVSINKEEKPNTLILLGVAVGLLGIVLVFSEHLRDFSNPDYVMGIVMIFVAAIAWAGSSIWIKKKNNDTNLYLNAGLQMFFGGVWLFPFSLAFDDLTNVTLSPQAVYSFIYLVIVGSIIAYVSYTYALRKLPMTIVSLYAYINPLVAVILGWLVLDEKLNGKIGLAIVITVAGIYIVNKGYHQLKEWRAAYSNR
jgi:drug/metabolite transporter (DMT)-like permease